MNTQMILTFLIGWKNAIIHQVAWVHHIISHFNSWIKDDEEEKNTSKYKQHEQIQATRANTSNTSKYKQHEQIQATRANTN